MTANKLSLTVAALLICGAGVLHAQTNLVAHWTFDEVDGTTAHDSSTRGYHGTLSSGAVFVAGGKSGNAVSLDKATNSLVNMGASFPGFTSGDFSLVAWIKTSTTDTSAFVAGKHTGGDYNGYFFLVNQSATYGQTHKAYFYDSTAPGGEAISSTSVNDGINWHQLVGVYTVGGNIQLYVDGVLERTKTSVAINGNTSPFLVGNGFTGLIDDVQVYDTALSSAEVQLLFLNPGQTTAIPEPSATGLWLAMGIGGFAVVRAWRKRRAAHGNLRC